MPKKGKLLSGDTAPEERVKKTPKRDRSIKAAGTTGKAATEGASSMRGKSAQSRFMHPKVQDAMERREKELKAGKKITPLPTATMEAFADELLAFGEGDWYDKLSKDEREAVQRKRRKRMVDATRFKKEYPIKGVADLFKGKYLGPENDPLKEEIEEYGREYKASGSKIVAKAKAREKARQLGIDDKLEYYPDGKIIYREAPVDKKQVDKLMDDLKKETEYITIEAKTVPDDKKDTTGKKRRVTKKELKEELKDFVDRSGTLSDEAKTEWKKRIDKSDNPKEVIAELKKQKVDAPSMLPAIKKVELPVKADADIKKKGKWTSEDEDAAAEAFMKASVPESLRGFITDEDIKPSEEQKKITGRQMLELPAPAEVGQPPDSGEIVGMGKQPKVGGAYVKQPVPPTLAMDPEFARKMAEQRRKIERSGGEVKSLYYEIGKGKPGYQFVDIDRTLISKADVEKLMKKQHISDPVIWAEFHDKGKVPKFIWEPIQRGQSKLQKRKGTEPIPKAVETDLKTALKKRRKKIEEAEKKAERELKADLKKSLGREPTKEELTREATRQEAEVRWVYKTVRDPKTGRETIKRVQERVHVYRGPGLMPRVEQRALSEGEKAALEMRRTAALQNIERQIALMQDAREAEKLAKKYIKRYTKKPAGGYRPAQVERAWFKKEPRGRWKLRIRREKPYVYFDIVAPTQYKDEYGYTQVPFNTALDVESKISALLDLMNMRIVPGERVEQYRIPQVGKKHMRLKYKVKAVKL